MSLEAPFSGRVYRDIRGTVRTVKRQVSSVLAVQGARERQSGRAEVEQGKRKGGGRRNGEKFVRTLGPAPL
jgi:hypothetical protein